MFGGVDIVVNNASAISITNSQATDMKRIKCMALHQMCESTTNKEYRIVERSLAFWSR
jgi:hypothetical protein